MALFLAVMAPNPEITEQHCNIVACAGLKSNNPVIEHDCLHVFPELRERWTLLPLAAIFFTQDLDFLISSHSNESLTNHV